MKIKNIVPKPYEKSIFPGISFYIEISYTKYGEAIVGINGWLKTDDEKIIAEIKEIEQIVRCEIGARGSNIDGNFKEDIYKTTLVTLLKRKALNHIEKRRMENVKGDVHLTLTLNIKTVESKATISHVHEIKPETVGLKSIEINVEGRKITNYHMLVYARDYNYYSYTDNKWILSGDRSPIFLAIYEQNLKEFIRIPSTDWIHDYAPKLELGEYFIVEIPKGKEIIKEAWSNIKKAEECFRRWDTKGVSANCREVGSLLDKTVKEKFGKDSFNYKERWGRAYSNFGHLASLDLHLEDIKKGPQYEVKDVKISKADAEHILITTKLLIKHTEELLNDATNYT